LPVELDSAALAVDLVGELVDLVLDRRLVRARQVAVLVLHGELADALEHALNVVHRAFSGLHHRDGVADVTAGLVEAVDLGGEALADRVARGVIGRVVDTKPGRQTLHRRGHRITGGEQVGVRLHRGDVRENRERHSLHLHGASFSTDSVSASAHLIGFSRHDLSAPGGSGRSRNPREGGCAWSTRPRFPVPSMDRTWYVTPRRMRVGTVAGWLFSRSAAELPRASGFRRLGCREHPSLVAKLMWVASWRPTFKD